MAQNDIYHKYYYQIGFAISGAGSALVGNYYAKRPYFAGIQKHIVFGIAGWMIGHYVDRLLKNRWMERDAIVRHYIELHPEDFADKRRKYKEIFDEWFPVR